jgi:hypothetical protein
MLPYLVGVSITPYTAKNALVDMLAEVGDKVTICGVTSWIFSQSITFDAACSSDISVPDYEEVAVDQVNQRLKRAASHTAVKVSEIEAACPIRYETRKRIAGEYVINQSNMQTLLDNHTWEQDVLYLPITGL